MEMKWTHRSGQLMKRRCTHSIPTDGNLHASILALTWATRSSGLGPAVSYAVDTMSALFSTDRAWKRCRKEVTGAMHNDRALQAAPAQSQGFRRTSRIRSGSTALREYVVLTVNVSSAMRTHAMSKCTFRTGALSASCGPSPCLTRTGAAESGVDVADGCSHDGLFLLPGLDSADALGCNHVGLFLPCGLISVDALGCDHEGRSADGCTHEGRSADALGCNHEGRSADGCNHERDSAEELGCLPPAVALGCSHDGRSS